MDKKIRQVETCRIFWPTRKERSDGIASLRASRIRVSPAGSVSSAVADVHRKSALYRSGFESYPTEKSKRESVAFMLAFLAYPIGFEPTAYRVGVCRSIQLGYG